MNIAGYYYITHQNDIFFIKNSTSVLNNLKDSPSVKYFWPIDPDNKTSALNFLIEAYSSGMSYDKFDLFLTKWQISYQDLDKYLDLLRLESMINIEGMVIVKSIFGIGLKGAGNNTFQALRSLCDQVGFIPDKENPTSFEVLVVPTNE